LLSSPLNFESYRSSTAIIAIRPTYVLHPLTTLIHSKVMNSLDTR